MSIRAKLLLSITLLVVIAFVVTGFVTVSVTRAHMIDRVDNTLLASREKSRNPGNNGQPKEQLSDQEASTLYGPARREIAVIAVGPLGEVVRADPSGFVDDPDPLPDLSRVGSLEPSQFYTTAAVDGSSLRYRLLVTEQRNGRINVLAAPLDNVDDTVRQLLIVIGITGAAVVIGLSAISWFVIRRGLAPVHEIAGTATAIAGGDLSQRVDYEDRNTEVGQLGLAFNSMISRIETAFDEKEESERRLRQFVADASHELRTPITSIRGYAELYRSGAASTPEEIDRAFYRIEAEGTRMGRLVEDLLLLARIDQGRPLEQEPVDLVRVVDDAVSDARAIEPERPIHLQSDAVAVVCGDEDRLRQVLANLLSNVRQHTAADTPVDVSLVVGDGEVSVRVRDSGDGINPDDLGRIFDRFFRVDTSRSRAAGGSGLGLAIVASVIESHHGTVAAASSPGEGTIFTIALPLAAVEEQDTPLSRTSDRQAPESTPEFGPARLRPQP